MEVSSPVPITGQTDCDPLLMERAETHNDQDHIINIARDVNCSLSSSNVEQMPGIHIPQDEDRPSNSRDSPAHLPSSSSSNRLNSRNSSFTRRSDGYIRRRRSPLNSGLWISVELIVILSQIVASIVVLSLSKDEHPQAPLFAWIVGYASGCVAMLPILYWRFRNRNRGIEQDSVQPHGSSSQINPPEATSYTAISVAQSTEDGNYQGTGSAGRNSRIGGILTSRLNGLVDHFKMALDCFFAIWFVVGNVWIFGGHSSPSDAPKLYRLCIVFLTFSCIGYAMPFILCATICCCLPCIISVLGFREDFSQTRGATTESINALPIYKFSAKKNENVNDQDDSGRGEGGVLAAGTEKERLITGEDAVCCICLANFADNDDLRELPCSHVFHVECVDKWLKINASCPLCKSEVGVISSGSPTARETNQN